MSKVRAYIKVEGKVQGVYFRSCARDIAINNNVTGWVKNVSGSSVKMLLEGEEKDVKTLVDWAHHGPPYARVVGVTVGWDDYKGEFKRFTVEYL